ncbi:MAG: hypothetical protein E3J72_17455 [Planctomycetota bacterium]|nr:MAG: hypothetical protein E3J72_17455 [Planctomycetota bacterium]
MTNNINSNNEAEFSSTSADKIEIITVHDTSAEELIKTNRSKLRNVLNEHADKIGKKHLWIGPLGITLGALISLIVALATIDFDKAGFQCGFWLSLVALIALLAGITTGFLYNKYGRESSNTDDIIKKLTPEDSGNAP